MSSCVSSVYTDKSQLIDPRQIKRSLAKCMVAYTALHRMGAHPGCKTETEGIIMLEKVKRREKVGVRLV